MVHHDNDQGLTHQRRRADLSVTNLCSYTLLAGEMRIESAIYVLMETWISPDSRPTAHLQETIRSHTARLIARPIPRLQIVSCPR